MTGFFLFLTDGGGWWYLQLSFALVVFALACAVCVRNVPAWVKFVAMAVCFVADMIMGSYAPLGRLIGGCSFEKGAAVFMLGHALYLVAFGVAAWRARARLRWTGFWVGTGISAMAVAALVTLYFLNPAPKAAMLVLGLVYGLFIGSVCVTVFVYAFAVRGAVAFVNAVGIVCFMISDMLIGVQAIGGLDFPWRYQLTWFFYPIGQFMMLLPGRKK